MLTTATKSVVASDQKGLIDKTNINKQTQDVSVNTSTRRRRTSALSLKKIHNKLEDIDYVSGEEDYSNKPKDQFSESDLVYKWKEFGRQLEADGELNMASIVNANEPTLKGSQISYALPNKLMQEQFGGVRPKLLNYLRGKLNNYSIQVKTVVVQSEKKKYIYTPQEKFQKLVEANPSVMLLKNTFGLDV